ncbi:TPA: helix-turn-helix domain-containing protein [Citrobacter amalonaticus]
MFSNNPANTHSLNSLLLCVQQAIITGSISSADIVNVLDIAIDISCHSSTSQTCIACDNDTLLSDRIQLAREKLGLSEVDLAQSLNTYSDHISGWECGTIEPPASVIIPLANALKCDPLWLLTGKSMDIAEES